MTAASVTERPSHFFMIANTHGILYTSTGRPAYPPGVPVSRHRMGNWRADISSGPPVRDRHMRRSRCRRHSPAHRSHFYARIRRHVARASRGVFDPRSAQWREVIR